MNIHEISRLAAAANMLRPDWPTASLQTFLERHLADRAYRDAAVAMAYVAADPESQTPRRVLEAGPWWRVGGETVGQIDTAKRCRQCGGLHPPGDAHHISAERARSASEAGSAAARQALATRRDDLCSHGVKARDCADCRQLTAPVEERTDEPF